MRGHGRLLFGLFLAALALRPQIIAIGPLVDDIQDDLGISHAVAGLLGTIPVLCMGLFAPVAAYASVRVGTRVAIGAAVCAIALGGLVRVLGPSTGLLLAFTLPVGIGIAVAGTLMPVAVKARFAGRPVLGTGIYTTGIQVGSAGAAALAVPLAHALGGWEWSLAAFSVAAGVSALAWLALMPPTGERAPARPPRLPVRRRVVWALAGVFTMIGVCFYGLSAWLPDAYVEEGWSQESAGALLAVVQATTVPTGILLPLLADRLGSRRAYLTGGAAVQLAGLLGVLLAPGGGWLWAVAIGLGLGTLFTMVMTLPLDVSASPAEAGAAAGLMLGVGYTLTGLAPFVLGAVRDATGSFNTSLWLVVGVQVCLVAASLTLTRRRLRPLPSPPSSG